MYCFNCGTQIPDNAQFCLNCGKKTSGEAMPVTVNMQSQTTTLSYYDTKEYLSYAKQLETNRLTLITTKNRLQDKINGLGHRKTFKSPVSDTSESFKFWFIAAFIVIFIIGVIISSFVCNSDSGDGFFANLLSFVTVVLIFFNEELLVGLGITLACAVGGGFIIGMIAAFISASNYRAALKTYNKSIANDKKRVEWEKRQIPYLQSQQAELDEKIAEVEAVLKEFYALNVVYPKYRSLIPIITFYEYFESGRHTNLADAYNKYEDELLHKTIISKLDVVISKLEQIRQNQVALYDAILESNSIAERICQKSDEIMASNKAIERNSAVAAYNAKVAADNSAITAYINLCRF